MSAATADMFVEPAAHLRGHLAVPGDKSISHRAVLIGALCDGETRVTGFGRSADTESTVAAVRALGVDVYEHGDDTLGRGNVGRGDAELGPLLLADEAADVIVELGHDRGQLRCRRRRVEVAHHVDVGGGAGLLDDAQRLA